MGDPNLVTTCNFHGQEYLFKMSVLGNNLEILITDKSSGEEWQCSYDATYIENLTHKTGNFKQFEIFVTMLKSGLLRTSECISLDLLTFEDLELLRSRKITKACGQTNNNRRYLIVTYCVEFDKIRYPLPLEYCGPPDPIVLQATIRRLESELARTKDELFKRSNNIGSERKISSLQKRIDELSIENIQLRTEVDQVTKLLHKKPKNQVQSLQKAMDKLEKSVISERNSHHDLVEKLRNEKLQLSKELEKLKWSEHNLKVKIKELGSPPSFCHGDYHKIGRRLSDSNMNVLFKRDTSKDRQSNRRINYNNSRHNNFAKLPPPWNSAIPPKRYSRLDVVNKPKTESRSSSASSTKYPPRRTSQNAASPRHSRSHSPHNHTGKSRSSSAASKTSSKGSMKIRQMTPKHSELDFKKLEDKIESLQRMLKRNFM